MNFLGPNQETSTSGEFARGGVKLSFDSAGRAHFAVAHTIFYPGEKETSYESKVEFSVEEGTARVSAFRKPEQPMRPHFKTIPVACSQVDKIPVIETVEQPEDTFGSLFEQGRYVADQVNDKRS